MDQKTARKRSKELNASANSTFVAMPESHYKGQFDKAGETWIVVEVCNGKPIRVVEK